MTAPSSPLEKWERGWRSHCAACNWNSRDLPLADPDAALHVLALHEVLCEGRVRNPEAS